MKNRLVREYLESLKEDGELDYIFPILLSSMNFRVVSSPRNSKGQPQHGKDVVAIGHGEDGILYRWYFELKGNSAKDITTSNITLPDGVIDSLREAKYVAYEAPSIPSFDKLPIKIVFVHNGLLQSNAEPIFNGFIQREFSDGNFERWDIEKLVELFSRHLFNESLFVDEECYSLIKKTLVLLDAPGWNTKDIDRIVDILLSNCPTNEKPNKRYLAKTFAALNLMLALIHKNCQDVNNILPAKQTSDRIVLKTWAWILKNGKEKKDLYLKPFGKIVQLHLNIYSEYLDKIIPLATCYKGLYMTRGAEAEKICYTLRCYDFMNDILYYFTAYNSLYPAEVRLCTHRQQLDVITRILKMNSGFDTPLLDNHSITLLLLLRFIYMDEHTEDDERIFIDYVINMCTNIIQRQQTSNMLPELYSNKRELCNSMYYKSDNYVDSSSMFLTVLLEIIAWMDATELYDAIRTLVDKTDVNLQIPYPIEDENLEVAFFEHNLHNEMCVETNINLPPTLKEFKDSFAKRYNRIDFKTDHTFFEPLKLLAHVHYKTECFPDFINFGFLKAL